MIWLHDKVSSLFRIMIVVVCGPQEMASQEIYGASKIHYPTLH